CSRCQLLIDANMLIELPTDNHDSLDPKIKTLIPLKKIYHPVRWEMTFLSNSKKSSLKIPIPNTKSLIRNLSCQEGRVVFE
ncbi:MAG: hypothetical protein AAFO69_20670, partial [Bacteroidota bacterium]